MYFYLNNSLVVAAPSEEGFASLAGERSEMESCRRFFTDTTQLVLKGIDRVQLNKK